MIFGGGQHRIRVLARGDEVERLVQNNELIVE